MKRVGLGAKQCSYHIMERFPGLPLCSVPLDFGPASQMADLLGGPSIGIPLTVTPLRTVHCNDKGVSPAHRIPTH